MAYCESELQDVTESHGCRISDTKLSSLSWRIMPGSVLCGGGSPPRLVSKGTVMEPQERQLRTISRLPGVETIRPREPPHNFEAEQALLGAILVNNAAYQRVAEFLKGPNISPTLCTASSSIRSRA